MIVHSSYRRLNLRIGYVRFNTLPVIEGRLARQQTPHRGRQEALSHPREGEEKDQYRETSTERGQRRKEYPTTNGSSRFINNQVI